MNTKDLEFLFNNVDSSPQQLSTLQLDAGTQQRSKMDKTAIEGYSESMKATGVSNWEPILVIELENPHTLPDGSELSQGALLPVDGFHRIEASIMANYDVFPAKVIEGTYETAVYYSLIANKRNGVGLKGKDFQKAIKRLYSMDVTWREHGKKAELALLFGWLAKTVERAVKAIDAEIKEQTINMFKQGKSDKEACDFSHKTLNTIKAWRIEYEQIVAEEEEERAYKDSKEDSDLDYLNLTIEQAMQLTDKTIQETILAILKESFSATDEVDEIPQESPQSPMQALANEWEALGDCYGIMGLTKEKITGYANKKAQVNRAYNKLLRKCHPDTHGANNEALEVLLGALGQVKSDFNIK
jgi:glutaredoxin